MKNDKREKLKEIFQAALEHPVQGREQFLSEACNGDDEMREEVRLLLSSFDEAGDFMESPAIGEVAETIAGTREVLRKGQRVERYEIVEKIGSGGMGEVFLAFDLQLERPAALKVLAGAAAGDDDRVRRFIREAKAASALNHPNILTIYEILNFENTHIIATEYIEGETLRERQKRDPLSPSQIIDIALQIGAALNAAHSAGIVHRDIKPENIMLRSDGLVKVLDFGLAKLTDRKNSPFTTGAKTLSAVTDPGIVMGTVSYMAPEQVRGAADIDSRADIWSLGVVLFETLSGELPFTGGSTSDVVAAILKNDPPALPDSYPPELREIISKTLRKERPERYSDIGEVIRDLKNVTGELGPQTIRTIPARTTREPEKVSAFPRFWYLVPALLLVAAVTGAAWWFLGKGGGSAARDTSSVRSVEVLSWSSGAGESDIGAKLSPDGKMIAFAGSRSGQKSIWIKQVSSGEAIQVTRDEFMNRNPVWSPDGSELAYLSNRGNQYGVWRIPVFGGSPRLITTLSDGSSRLKSWSPRNILYYNSSTGPNLFALDIDSLRQDPITGPGTDGDLVISPSEEFAAYVPIESENPGIRIMSLKTGDIRDIAQNMAVKIRNIVWGKDNRTIFFNATVNDVSQIFETDINGAAPKQMTFSDKDSIVRDASLGNAVLYSSVKEESDIWAFDLTASREIAAASDIDSELWATTSPDAKYIAYHSVKNLGQGGNFFDGPIMTRQIEGGAPAAELARSGFLASWSPDGQRIAFIQMENEDCYITTINAHGGEQVKIPVNRKFPLNYTTMPYNHTQTKEFSWSPDGKKIAYHSDKGGQYNIWTVNADGSDDAQFSQNTDLGSSVFCPIWSNDGRQMAYAARSESRGADNKFRYTFFIENTNTKNSRVVFQTSDYTKLIGWSSDEEGLILASGPGDQMIAIPPEVAVFRVSLKTGVHRSIAALKDAHLYNTCLTWDGKQVIFAANRDGRDNIWMVPAAGGEQKQITNNSDPRYFFSGISSAAGHIFYDKQARYKILSILTDNK